MTAYSLDDVLDDEIGKSIEEAHLQRSLFKKQIGKLISVQKAQILYNELPIEQQ